MAKTQTNKIEYGDKISSNTEFRKASALEVGQCVEGTVLAFRDSTKFPGNTNLVMKGLSGETFTLSPAGDLKYIIRDGKIKIGDTVKIERAGSKKVKGMTSSTFNVYIAKNGPGLPTQASANDDI